MKILLVPLDERPVSIELPSLIAAIAGGSVVAPPVACLPSVRRTGDVDAISTWLRSASADADGVVVSLEGLGFGGLIPSRIGTEPLERVHDRWSVLRSLGVPVHASVVIPRTPDSVDAFEEPEYWTTWGPDLHALSSALGSVDSESGTGPTELGTVPDEVRHDWLTRRLRHHALGLAALGLLSDGTISRLIIGVDDAVPGSLSAAAQHDLAVWATRLGLDDRAIVGPGADETAAVLTARIITDRMGVAPRVMIACAEEDGLDRVAPYETGPVRDTARGQLRAAGATVVDTSEEADAVLVVHAPDGEGDWAVAPPATTPSAAATRTVELVRSELAAGRAVAVADVAQPNGADPALVRALLEAGLFFRLDGFAAWNTAGNTLGTVAAHLCVALSGRATGMYDERAAVRHLRLRLIEDAAFMSVARARLRRELGSPADRHDHIDNEGAAAAHTARFLVQALTGLGATQVGDVLPEQVSFPWMRSFEIRLDPAAGES